MCAHPGLDGAVVVILLGGKGWRVDGDVWISVREELVGVGRVCVGVGGWAVVRVT